MKKKNQGITLIALIITIIIMLILVAVSIQIVINSGLFETAKNAGLKTEQAYENEANLGNEVNINGKIYNSAEEYVAEINKPIVEPENIDDWEYTVEEDGTITLNCYKGSDTEVVIPNYINGVPVKKIGTTNHGNYFGVGSFWDLSICEPPYRPTYYWDQKTITKVTISKGITEIAENAFQNSIALEEIIIPEGLTNTSMDSIFSGCTSLTKAPEIPSSVTSMEFTFEGCTNLTTVPEIPSSVTDMYRTFYGCTSLTGDLVINANPTNYTECLKNCATNEGCELKLSGSSTMLNEILGTANGNANITIKE